MKIKFFVVFLLGLIAKFQAQDFNLKLKAGIRNNDFEITRDALNREIDFGNLSAFTFGIEGEVVLPSSKTNKWAILLEPMYLSFSASDATNLNSNNDFDEDILDINYKSIEIGIGSRYYININTKNNIYLNLLVIYDANTSSKFDFKNANNMEEFKSNLYLSPGIGISHNNRLSLEFRHGFKRELALTGDRYKAPYSNFSLLFGYAIF